MRNVFGIAVKISVASHIWISVLILLPDYSGIKHTLEASMGKNGYTPTEMTCSYHTPSLRTAGLITEDFQFQNGDKILKRTG